MDDRPRGAILVLPTATAGQQGPVGAWVSTAGWATATRRVVGDVWIVTPAGLMSVEDVRRRAAHPQLSAAAPASWRRRLPVIAKTAVKDAREWRRARTFDIEPNGPWRGHDVRFVWQRHELFHTAGIDLAAALGVPSVLFVPAPLMWQAGQWGVRRPGGGHLLEQFGEARILGRGDLVACGSELVAEQVSRLGVAEARAVIVRTGFDPDVFNHRADGGAVRRRLGLGSGFVVGWVGSFRKFHGLDQLVDALAPMSETQLLLVGDGPERSAIEALARRRGVSVVCTGTVPHEDLPAHIAAMDTAVVMAQPGTDFHYSPLKLAEYLACGVAVIAPRAGGIPAQLADGVDALLVDPGDVPQLTRLLMWLRDQPEQRARIARQGRETAVAHWSWDRSVERVVAALDRRGTTAPGTR
ncbi:MAG TPA: glycosyltransferase [Acidimicrobiia bacterium]|nr:glycosyltransferase [Acidimicrobiia bacterium]